MIRPKAKKYNVMRLAKVGSQKEQKHLKCSMIFMVVAFDKCGVNTSQHMASYFKFVKHYYVTKCNNIGWF